MTIGQSVSKVLLTGAAGFIGAAVSHALLDREISVVGLDNLNDYYPIALKRARLDALLSRQNFSFHQTDISNHDALRATQGAMDVDRIVHLAAQAGIRHSIENPFGYARSNLVGHLSMLELARASARKPLIIYASSSSVYGANTKSPFSETDRVDAPVSLYAATKRADELMSESYARLYGIPQIGLRFFTVYGRFGRPDMAYWMFAENIMQGRPITLFNYGDLERDFTYIDDIVSGVVAVVLGPMKAADDVPHRIYNIGNSRPEPITRLVETLERAIGKKADVRLAPMQPGDVRSTSADISAIAADYGFRPATSLAVGIPKFVDWFRKWRSS